MHHEVAESVHDRCVLEVDGVRELDTPRNVHDPLLEHEADALHFVLKLLERQVRAVPQFLQLQCHASKREAGKAEGTVVLSAKT